MLSPEEKRIVAFHESGHAVVSWFLKHCLPLVKVSIIPRGAAALGYAQYLPNEQYIHTQEELLDSMCMALGGRAAEDLVFGHLSTGAQDDLQRVTKMAYAQVSQYGFSDIVRNMAFPTDKEAQGLHRRPYSELTALKIDKEVCVSVFIFLLSLRHVFFLLFISALQVKRLVELAYSRTKQLLQERKDELTRTADYLMEHEVLFRFLFPTSHQSRALIHPSL